jgi:hypothetical protein
MAIYGVGSNWSGEELKDRFFEEGKFILGWNEDSAKDIYAFVASLKVGDILYIKANRPGARTIRVKGVGIVTKNLLTCMSSGELAHSALSDWEHLFVDVAWVHRDEFQINIPEEEGRLTNIRAATIYEEYLPLVQEAILKNLIEPTISKQKAEMLPYARVETKNGTNIQLEFEGDEGPIKAVSLAEYLQLFRCVYSAIDKKSDQNKSLISDSEKLKMIWEKLPAEELIISLRRHAYLDWPFYPGFEKWPEDETNKETLHISAISKNSPLVIVLCGMAIALTVAVIVSGGSIDFSLPGHIKCKLPPLGKGIEALRKALRKKL